MLLALSVHGRVMIGGSNYFRFYDLQTNQLEQQCASDALNIVSLTTVCNGWVYAATDGEQRMRPL